MRLKLFHILISCLFVFITSNNSIAQNFNLVGNAVSLGGDCYEITPAEGNKVGCIWYNQQINLNDDFDLRFELNLGSITNGADGMAFVFQTAGPNYVGGSGGGMGFSGIQPSLAIEFDTYYNNASSDLTVDHIAFQKNGNTNHTNANNLAGPVQMSATQTNVKDGQEHKVRVTWNATTKEESLL